MPAGDLTLGTPKSIPVLVLLDFSVVLGPGPPSMAFTFAEGAAAGAGPTHGVRVTDTGALGFDYSAGVFADQLTRVISGEFTKLAGILFGAGGSGPGARRTAAIQALKDDLVITLTGTVG